MKDELFLEYNDYFSSVGRTADFTMLITFSVSRKSNFMKLKHGEGIVKLLV